MEPETREQMENIGYKHNKNVCKEAFVKSIPILCSYLFVSMPSGRGSGLFSSSIFDHYVSSFASVELQEGE